MTARDDQGRPTCWETVRELEFDANERDSWHALAEFENAVCEKCGRLRAVCSTPGGVSGEGFYVHQRVCYATMIEQATQRRIDSRFRNTTPDSGGYLPTDGVCLDVSPFDDPDAEDVLGLG